MIVLLLLLIVLAAGVTLFIRRRTQQQRHRRLRQLRQWLGAQHNDNPYLQRWINGLSTSEAEVLLDLLTGYCTSLNWELTWLFTPQLQKVPALQQALEEGVKTYAGSILTALQLGEEVQLYKAYSALVQKPTQRKQFALIQKLYQELTQRGAITIDPNAKRWFRRRPTRRQQINAVIDAFEREPVLAMAVLKLLLVTAAQADVEQLTGVALPVGAAA